MSSSDMRRREVFPLALRRVAVIDIGSNSGRVVVLQIRDDGALDVIDELRAPLRLARAMDFSGRLTSEAFETTLTAMGDFVALARGQGAEEIRAVGTFAMREADNGRVLAELIRDRFGVHVEIVDGYREARFGFVGAVYGIDVTDGLSIDIGGGSMQLVRFRNRTAEYAWTFPFGALRLTDTLFTSDPPNTSEVRDLRRYLRTALKDAGVPALDAGEALVGTGGTIRNLAKVDLRRQRPYPLGRLHAYTMPQDRVRRMARSLSRMSSTKRGAVPGLNSSRVDSIVAGALAVDTVMQVVGASTLHVSGQGLREGVIRSMALESLPSPMAVRAASVRALCSEFSRWNQPHADRRARLAEDLFDLLIPHADPQLREAVTHAAQIIDVGATIDVYNRHERAADIVVESDLQGFSHPLLVAVASILRLAERPGVSLKIYRPVVDVFDAEQLDATAALLDLADQVERRSPPGAPETPTVSIVDGELRVCAPVSRWWRVEEVATRLRTTFGIELKVIGSGE
ncbi:MAG: Ppx/GppA phosphatase family protein [Chloroflexi bacterium]|nr:Ppx/GppA phosphatase family protein [Chloroflexota bacterium]